MRRIRPGRLLTILFLLVFAVFFGLDLATKGIERVQGPMENAGKSASVAYQPVSRSTDGVKTGTVATAPGTKAQPSANPLPSAKAQSAQAAPAAAEPKIEMKESFLNHLSNRVGDALRRLARAVIELVVSIFDSIIS